MATPKKKHLIELMIEAGVKWPDGAEYAAQDKRDNKVYFFNSKPTVMHGDDYFSAENGPLGHSRLLPSLCRNWHQTIVTREQYALADAESGDACMDTSHLEAKSNQVRESEDAQAVEWHTPPSIGQLTTDYHAKAAEADRLQAVADDALKAAGDALIALEKAGELIGLVISIDTKPKAVEQPEITDWRNFRVGDLIWIGGRNGNDNIKGYCEILEIDNDDDECPFRVIDRNSNNTSWPSIKTRKWRFISRP